MDYLNFELFYISKNGNFSPKAAVFAFYTLKKTKNTEGVLLSFVFYIFADFLKLK
jgi:hypothetical protein